MKPRQLRRSGLTLVESALVFQVVLILVLVLFDLGQAVLHQHLLTDAAQHVARQASVHGTLADETGTWGPAPLGPVPADNAHPACGEARRMLIGFTPSEVTVRVEWLDGEATPGRRVRVTLTTDHRLIVGHLWNGGTVSLKAVSIAIIAH